LPVEPRWLTVDEILAAHTVQIDRFGGASGIRDRGMLESALAHPRNQWAYNEDDDLLALAAGLCCALARNHPFIDGNKRAAAVGLTAFLRANGYILAMPNDTSLGRMIEAVIVRDMTEQDLVDALDPFVESV
jgi:death-on-curing protein